MVKLLISTFITRFRRIFGSSSFFAYFSGSIMRKGGRYVDDGSTLVDVNPIFKRGARVMRQAPLFFRPDIL